VLSLYILSLKQLLFRSLKSLGYREKFEGDIEVIETENKFVLWCKISSKLMKLNSDLLLGIVYIPPEYSRYPSRDAFSQIENIKGFKENIFI
jgi:hypothetical protein